MATSRRMRSKKHIEDIVATGITKMPIPADLLDCPEIPTGTKLSIGRVIKTPMGIRLRIAHTNRWIGLEHITFLEPYAQENVFDYTLPKNTSEASSKTQSFVSSGQRFKPAPKCGTKKDERFIASKSKDTRSKGMDKKVLKDVINSFSGGEEITMTFIGDLAHRTGKYTVVETKTGRGKGGSRIVVLKNEQGELFETGTPKSNFILNVVTPDGKMYGFETTTEVPKEFSKDLANHEAVKEKLASIVGKSGMRLRIQSTEPQFNGDFTVEEASLQKGRFGQLKLTLAGDDGNKVTVWSYRHSGVLDNVEILSD